ncbi:hypothetical protein B9G55_21150 [Saccharibacillus sp. O16]|nr:hypothetical protein B9G55_21150 [Saccharibacillus sp. O16]
MAVQTKVRIKVEAAELLRRIVRLRRRYRRSRGRVRLIQTTPGYKSGTAGSKALVSFGDEGFFVRFYGTVEI